MAFVGGSSQPVHRSVLLDFRPSDDGRYVRLGAVNARGNPLVEDWVNPEYAQAMKGLTVERYTAHRDTCPRKKRGSASRNAPAPLARV